jgi:hypothetical protein
MRRRKVLYTPFPAVVNRIASVSAVRTGGTGVRDGAAPGRVAGAFAGLPALTRRAANNTRTNSGFVKVGRHASARPLIRFTLP